MLVQEIMNKNVVTIDSDDNVFNASKIYQEKKVGCLVVTKNDFCIGIITERDIIERTLCLEKNPKETKVLDIMTPDIKTIHALDTIEDAIDMIKKYHIKKLPVVINDIIIGIITVTDISKARPDLTKRFMNSWVKAQWRS